MDPASGSELNCPPTPPIRSLRLRRQMQTRLLRSGSVAADRSDLAPMRPALGEICGQTAAGRGNGATHRPMNSAQIVLNVGWFPHFPVMQQARTHRVA